MVAKTRKLALLGRAASETMQAKASLAAPALEEAAFVIAAVKASRRTALRAPLPEWWNVQARTARMLELLASFERRGATTG